LSAGIFLFLLAVAAPLKSAATQDNTDSEDYKFKFDAHWWIAKPSGSIQGDTGRIDFQKDLNFGDYSTFYGLLEWKPRRKHHLYCYIAPNQSTMNHVLARQIEFRGQTFFVAEKVHAELQSFVFSPGYEYDVISRARGHLGIQFQVNLFDWKGSISTQGGITLPDSTITIARSASKSFFFPLPTGGPTFRYYMLPRRLYVDGGISGMYFFGYGNFISTNGFLGCQIGHHFSVRGGYLLGSRADIHGSSNRLGIRLTQQGAVVGLEGKW
jgi:hypothetical protein